MGLDTFRHVTTSAGAGRTAARDDIERAHLVDPTDRTWSIARASVSPDLGDLARRFWIPVWDVPEGRDSVQRVLQYPVCLIVVSDTYTRFYGVVSGLSHTDADWPRLGGGPHAAARRRAPADPRAGAPDDRPRSSTSRRSPPSTAPH